MSLTNSQKEHETEKLILALLVARLLMLLKFRQMYQDGTAKLWLMYQLTDQQQNHVLAGRGTGETSDLGLGT